MTQKQSQLTARKEKTAEEAQIRRDTVALLEYWRDQRVTGTQSSGNLPIRAINEINERLIPPMTLTERIGDKVYHVRSEFDVWRIYLPHVLAKTAGLVTGGIARRIRLTPKGEDFLASDTEHQLWTLLNTWWHRIDWVMAFPVSGLARGLPPRFSTHTVVHTTVVNILNYFGAIETYFRPKRIGKGSIKELSQFRITPLGDHLLRSLR